VAWYRDVPGQPLQAWGGAVLRYDAPGTRAHMHHHPRGEEIDVLEGELQDQRGRYPAGSWQRLHADPGHAPFADVDTLILLRNGHLRH
jgi:anti-sigma factor ChrR (cupin superfamily)